MENSKSDKQPFNAKAAVEAAKGNPGYYKSLTPHERLIIANYLNSIFITILKTNRQEWTKRLLA